ncbi:hypothetical protein HYDPIDRAFT_40390 [Hydnomerulius pinastri MD-312]|uniref:YEATS domain-containing protein n=1 Tax=Hydnomerulius pinastri MD-312 TaxID=994086 RepID=A0A0C9WFB7_9AGAM|nr:hypothetical protein HYDPIDRAFT_40390 [Hydnomerulius pinastri MD-312]
MVPQDLSLLSLRTTSSPTENAASAPQTPSPAAPGQHRWVRMSHSSITGQADLRYRGLKRRRHNDETSDEDFGSESVRDDVDSVELSIARHIRDEVDLEVAVRERLASTIEGRIQWAVLLFDSLTNPEDLHSQPPDVDEFQDAALDAFDALEAPSAFLFETRSPEEPFSPRTWAIQQPQRVPKTRPSRTPKPSNQKKLLYIRLPSGTSDSQFAILACPICSRTQFSTLQGLLNHARLAHGVEWASHDACITACAIAIATDDPNWETYGQDGVEVPWGGSVVGLQRLFERAVGVDGNLSASTPVPTGLEASAPAPSTLLSRTLGLHVDSPALAQFLGRAPKRRCINVYNDQEDVDIMTGNGEAHSQDLHITPADEKQLTKRFRMVYPHRNTARADLDLMLDVHMTTGSEVASHSAHMALLPAGSTTSRFHITARVRLEDRSLYLTDGRRAELGSQCQYRWMLGVTAPSYSLPLVSFLTRVTVIPPKSVSPVPLSVQSQPFAVIGTANEPFLANVVMEWIGGGKMEVEHWVDLDQSNSSVSVAGSEQMLDVELDRNAPLLPAPKGNSPSLPSLDRNFTTGPFLTVTSQSDSLGNGSGLTASGDSYEQVLRNLLPRVPMTIKDLKPRSNVHVPYKLVTSPAHLLALVPGRRKAIEWARARTLHGLYVEQTSSLPRSQCTPLTVGDVYAFLEDASLFPRPSPSTSALVELKKKEKEKEKEKEGTPVTGEESCPVCGIKKRLHPGYDVKSEDSSPYWRCTVVPQFEQHRRARLPLASVVGMLTGYGGLESAIHGLQPPPQSMAGSVSIYQPMKISLPPFRYSPRDLLTLSPPELILAVQKSISTLHLPRFPSLPSHRQNPTFLESRERTERNLAPAALLSATLKPFISTLLRSAIEVAKRDAMAVSGANAAATGGKGSRMKRAKKIAFVLTPGHVLRGLQLPPTPAVADARQLHNISVKEATALCLTHIGAPLDFGRGVVAADPDMNAPDRERSIGQVIVKAEPE